MCTLSKDAEVTSFPYVQLHEDTCAPRCQSFRIFENTLQLKKKKWPRENMSDGSSNPVAVVSDFQEDSKRDLPDGPELGPQRHCRAQAHPLVGSSGPAHHTVWPKDFLFKGKK